MVTALTSAKLEATLSRATGSPAKVEETSSVGGGSINDSRIVKLEDGRRFFVKTHPCPPPGFFGGEALGLETLAEAGVLRVPRVVALAEDVGGPPFLVLEAIEPGRRREDFFETFGRKLAELHRTTSGDRGAGGAPHHDRRAGGAPHTQFGFSRDNYIGSTPQLNRWTGDWCEFWRRYRLGYQLDLARRRGHSDPVLDRLGDRLLDRLEEWLAEPEETPCLLHGDLWSGNYMVGGEGEAVLLDPAVYYGRREADLAMTELFGGFDERFYAAYEEVWPLAPGSEVRLELYRLYHLLNHLNLFGGGYRASCIEILRRYA